MNDFQTRLQHAIDAGFLIERELGGGGMSRVFLATERSLQRRVVIKVLPPELAAGVNVERFRREIQLAAQLQHPHIVPVLAAGDDDSLLWYSMPYIEGESLRGALSRQERLPARDVVRILHDVVDALAYAHGRGIVHRDIKPDNILTSGLHALVTDFGVAKALSAASPIMGGTATGMAIGTPAYMAPEQLAADPAADHRVDLYAVGLLAYELLTGKSPFSGISPQATLAAQLTQMPHAPHLATTGIPEPLSVVIMHCLEKDANKRPATAQALLAELDALAPMSGASVSALTPGRSKRWPLLAAAAVVLLAVTYGVAQQASLPSTIANTGSNTKSANGTPREPRRDSTASRTLVVNASAGLDTLTPIGATDDNRVQVPVVITKAETLAIIAAYRKRTAAANGDTGTKSRDRSPTGKPDNRVVVAAPDPRLGDASMSREAFLAEVQRILGDSIAAARQNMEAAMQRFPASSRFDGPRNDGPPRAAPASPVAVTPLLAPPTDGRVRVAVSNYENATGRREYALVGREIARFLRSALPADRFDVVADSTTDRAFRGTDALAMGWGLRSDFVVSGVVSQRADSLVLLTIFTDVRGGRLSRITESVVPQSDAKRAFDPAMAKVNMWLDSARTRSARGQPSRGGRGQPTDGQGSRGRQGAPPEFTRRPPP